MPKKNDPSSSPTTPPSTVRQLFRSDSTKTPPSPEEETPPAAKGGFIKRFQSSWQSLLASMKQPAEEEQDDEPETEEEPSSADLTAAADDTAPDISPDSPPVPTKSAADREEPTGKKGFFSRFRPEHIEADQVSADNGEAVPAPSTPASSPIETPAVPVDTPPVDKAEEQPNHTPDEPSADTTTPSDAPISEKATTEPADAPAPAASAVIYTAPMPAPPQPEPPSAVSDQRKDTFPILQAVRQDGETVPLPPIPPPSKTVPAHDTPPVSSHEAPPVTLPPVSSDDLLTVDGRSIESLQANTIYDASPSSAPADETANLTEGRLPPVTYRYQHVPPFIVMAGKFTKTLQEEYEAVRQYRRAKAAPPPVKKEALTPPATAATAATTATTVPTVPPVTPKTSDAAPEGSSAALPLHRKAKKEPPKKKPAEKTVLLGEWEPYDEEPDEPKTDKKKKRSLSRAEKHHIAKQKRSERRFRLRQLFSGEEEFDPEEEVTRPAEPKPQLDDYNEESDADAIKTEISSNFQAVFARTLILLAASAASITASLVAQCTDLFRETIRNGWLWFALISFFLFAVSVIVSRRPIVNGLMPLRHMKGNSDTAVGVASVAVAIQSVTAIFTPDIYLSGTLHLYTPLVILALFFNAVGKLLIITRTHYNFNFLVKPYPKYAGKIFNDTQNAQKMTRELPLHKPLIGYTKRARFAANFLQLSYAPDPIEKMASRIAPWTTVISLVCGIVFGILRQSFIGGVTSFALTACISVPILTLVGVNLPLRRLCKTTLRSGAMITSYETVKQFCDTNAIMIDSSQLYPKGTVTLTGMRSFKQSKLTDALQAGAAIMYAVNGTMIHIFENIVQCSKENLPRVDNVIYEDGKGLVGWIKEQRILIGNRALLKAHNIEPPDEEVEERFRKRGSDIVYISVSGDLIAMFGLSYKTYKHIANELRVLEQSGVNFIVRTVDPNLTREKVAEQFGLFHRCITILPTGLGNICHEEMAKTDDQARAYLITRGKLSSFAKAVSGCIKMKMGTYLARAAQGISVGVGLLLFSMISFVSGFEKLGCLEMLIYIGFWSLTTLIVSLIKK